MRRKRQQSVLTRDRILNAAILRFSRFSYEKTGLRDIAKDADVDVSYVHRCFGSKEQLFADALAATIPLDLLAGTAGDLSGFLAKQIFARDGASAEVGALDLIIRSLTSPEASRVLREFILNSFIDPLAGQLDRTPNMRIALIAALLTGVGIFRNVLRIPSLGEPQGGELEKVISRVIKGLMTKDPALRRV